MPYGMQRSYSSYSGALLASSNTSTNALIHAGTLADKAYDKFWNNALKKASLGVSLLEGHKSLTMITNRVNQLINLVKAFKRLDVRAINRLLSISKSSAPSRSRLRRGAANFANNWLEYTFGWTPLIQDIWDACNVLQQDFASFKHKATVRDLYVQEYPWDGGGSFATISDCVYVYGANIRVTNPNLLLANQLGLLNPAYVLWDKVAFSFVVDWFVPVGKFLRSLSQTIGLSIENAFKQASAVTRGVAGYTLDGVTRLSASLRSTHTVRSLGVLPPPDLLSRVRLPKLDPWLAITSLSLLSQQFLSVRH
jgi:hypothetical protein